MATAVTTREKAREEKAARPGRLVPAFGEFPFFLSRMRDEFDRLFERFSRDWPALEGRSGWRWDVQVKDGEDKVIVEAEAPGFEAADFDVQVSDNTLTLRACHKTEKKTKEGKEEYRERECYEAMTLPAGIDKTKVEAKYGKGILTITMPKTAEGKAKKVPVKTE
ncbi:MAG: Hsp20/alpha crystallin family protein [Gemmataceae bacterium]